MTALPRGGRLAVLAGAIVAALLAAALLARGCERQEPPSDDAARLVPATALVYVNVSTDGERTAVQRATDLAERFDAYEPARDGVLRRLSGGDEEVDAARDVAPWLGDEAAFALLDAGGETAGSLVAVEVTDAERARELLARNPRPAVRRVYKGTETIRYGRVTTAIVDGFLLIGQDPSVQGAIDRAGGDVSSLAGDGTYRRATAELPRGRAATAYASADGVRRLLVPQGDLVGGLSVLLDQPALEGVAMGVEALGDDRLRVVVRSALDAEAQERSPSPFEPFEPELVDAVPEDALAYLGVAGVSGALQRLIVSAVGGAGAGDVGELLERVRSQLEEEAGVNLQRDLLALFEGEVALVAQRATPAPILTLVTPADDEAATRRTLDRLRDPLARLLRPEGEAALRWDPLEIEGDEAWTLRLPNGGTVTYLVADGRLILSTSPDGARGVVAADGSLPRSDAYDDVLSDRPGTVGTLGFLDFTQLLELGEQTGLNDSRTYLAARDDLRRVRAVGVSSTSGEGEATAEILISIP